MGAWNLAFPIHAIGVDYFIEKAGVGSDDIFVEPVVTSGYFEVDSLKLLIKLWMMQQDIVHHGQFSHHQERDCLLLIDNVDKLANITSFELLDEILRAVLWLKDSLFVEDNAELRLPSEEVENELFHALIYLLYRFC